MAEPDPKRPRVVLKGNVGRPAPAGRAESGPARARTAVAAGRPAEKPAAGGHSEKEKDKDKETEANNAGKASEKSAGTAQAHVTSVARFRLSASRNIDSGPVVTFDVSGRLFKLPAQLVRSRPDTLLARLLDGAGDASSSSSKPIFVDASPDRFPLVMDWYRYGEVHVPCSVPVAALLQDARKLQLPEEIVVNGITRSTRPDTAEKVARNLVDNIISRWPGFRAYFDATLESIRSHYQSVGDATGSRQSASSQEAEEAYDFPPFVLSLFGDSGWLEPQQVCSPARARVLALKLEERGYRCLFSETELVVTLPLALRGEAGAGPPHGEEEAEGEVGEGG